MHFIITAIGSYGDVHPMVGLGTRLAARGHRVQVVTNPYFAEVVSGAGLELLPILTADDYKRLIDFRHVWHPTKSVPFLFREAIVEVMREMYQTVGQAYEPGESVVVAHTLDAGSRLYREHTGAKVAIVTLAPQAMWSRYRPPELGAVPMGPRWPRWWNQTLFWMGSRVVVDPALRRPLNEFRRELGLKPIQHLFPDWWFASDLNLCLFPEWFGPLQPDWPRPIEAVGFPLWDAGELTPLSSEVQQFLDAGPPPIVFTPGTANKQAKGFFATAAAACQRLGRRGLLLSKFAEQIPASLPAGVQHFEFVPLSRVVRRSAAMVHHGGIGTCSQALAAGVPQLLRPMAFDQFDNADRLIRLGVARQLPVRRFTANRLVRALQELLESRDVATACADYAQQCDAGALDRACDLVERLGNKPA